MSNIVLRRVIAFATEQGTSQNVAEQIGRMTGIDVVDIKTINVNEINLYSLIIFVVSTYGRGAAPESVREYWSSFEKVNLKCNNVKFAVLGCGSSNFRKTFLGFAKKVEEKMINLGATKLVEMGINDEAEEQTTDLTTWVRNIPGLL